MVLWLVSLPLAKGRKDAAWELLQEKSSGMSANYKLEVPELRVGTLDSLMALSDDLSKTAVAMEAVTTKIRRQVAELNPGSVKELKVEGAAAETYLQRFRWDEAKYPARRPLRDTADKIIEVVGRVEDDLKVKVAEYNTLKSAYGTAQRKATGSVAVKDLAMMVTKDNLIDSENLISLFIVVSKFAEKEFLETYETLSPRVVPRSAKLVSQDNDYLLMAVVVFKRNADEFKTAARAKGYQVREYAPAAEGVASGAATEQLKADLDTKRGTLEQWCKTAYGEVFTAWIHICVLRIFVESILRYGLPPAFQAAVVKPVEKLEGKLRVAMAGTFADRSASFWKDDGTSSAGAGLMDTSELHPYVSLTINIDS